LTLIFYSNKCAHIGRLKFRITRFIDSWGFPFLGYPVLYGRRYKHSVCSAKSVCYS